MRICHGLAGEVIEVEDQELQFRRPLDVVKQHVQERWNANTEDLIILTSSGGMIGADTSSGVSGPTEDVAGIGADVFVFMKSALDPTAEVAPERLSVADEPDGDASSVGGTHEGYRDELLRRATESCGDDPASQAFRGNLSAAQRDLSMLRPVAALAARTAKRLEVQRLAAQAVLANVANHRAACSRSMELFTQKYERVQERLEQSVAHVEVSMRALAECALHPAMQTADRGTLADVVPQERILQFTSNLQAERARFEQRVDKLRRLDSHTQALCGQVVDKATQLLQEDLAETVARDIQTQSARAEQELLPELCDLVPRAGAAASEVLEDERRHAVVVEGLTGVSRNIQGLLPELRAGWERRHTSFVQRLREVAFIQTQVRSVARQAALLEEEINDQQGHSQQLDHLQRMPKAHQKMLAEIARRRQFRDRYVAQASNARAALTKTMEEENARRRRFTERYGCHLPADLVSGLGALAPPPTVELADFDVGLPDIDPATLQQESTTLGDAALAPGTSAVQDLVPSGVDALAARSVVASATDEANGALVGGLETKKK